MSEIISIQISDPTTDGTSTSSSIHTLLDDEKKEITVNYHHLVTQYLNGNISIDTVKEWLRNNVSFSTSNLLSIEKDQYLIIASHPYLSRECRINTKNILNNTKGENTFNYPVYHFRVIRDMLLEDCFPSMTMKTVITPIGYAGTNSDTNSIELPTENGTHFCVNYLRNNRNHSLVIFPEGGYKMGETFHKGFYYIARDAGIKKIILLRYSDNIGLFEKNRADAISVEEFPNLNTMNEIQNYTESLRQKLFSHQYIETF